MIDAAEGGMAGSAAVLHWAGAMPTCYPSWCDRRPQRQPDDGVMQLFDTTGPRRVGRMPWR
jgi:hypothetical protein